MAPAVIFDLDGTLVTWKFDIREWRKVLLELMGARGFVTDGLTVSTPTQDVLDSAKLQAGGQPGRYEAFRAKAYAELDSLELQGLSASTVFPDAVDTLRKLRSKGVRLCVLTNSGRRPASVSLAKSDLSSYFEFVLTRDDTERMKPRPDGLIKAVGMLGLPREAVFYVGDSTYDVMAARQAGVKSVGVSTSNYSMEQLSAAGADFVVPSISGILGILGI